MIRHTIQESRKCTRCHFQSGPRDPNNRTYRPAGTPDRSTKQVQQLLVSSAISFTKGTLSCRLPSMAFALCWFWLSCRKPQHYLGSWRKNRTPEKTFQAVNDKRYICNVLFWV